MKKYRIGELAREMGVSHEYIKYYEKNRVKVFMTGCNFHAEKMKISIEF